MIGLFDSGLGGLTVVRRVRELLPRHDLLFFADQAHVPYGDRDADDLMRLLRQNLDWLNRQGAGVIAAACNTSCAVASRYGWPSSRAVVLDLIDSAAHAIERGGYQRIGVFATVATAQSGAYARKIRERVPDAQVYEIAAPALVPLVEAGKSRGDEARLAVEQVCAQLPDRVEAVIYACTHYPMLDEHFEAALGMDVARLDPAIAHAQRTADLVRRLDLPPGGGATRCVTNGDLLRFAQNVAALIGDVADVTTETQRDFQPERSVAGGE